MHPPLASLTVCSICGERLNVHGVCVACLLRGGLDDGVQQARPKPVSDVFGDFEIARRPDGSLWELGRGAMGVTYRATDKVLHRDVALKVIETPSGTNGSKAIRERFMREARSAAALRHPNVAGVFHLSASPDLERCYFAMELVEGETLEARVRRDGPLEVKLALDIAIQVTRALNAAAARGLIHRDLKPANIMLARTDTGELDVKVIDFGLAKAAGEMDFTHGGFVGTPAFASPEQFESSAVDVRSDIYALGATLWFALAGRAPFSATTIQEMRAARSRTPLPIEQLTARKSPPVVIALLRSCLAVNPAERPGSPRELAQLLGACRRKLNEVNKAGLGGFFHHLKKRNLVRIAIAYALTAWLLAQIATQIFPFFEVPAWGIRLVILLLCLGLPIALMVAWAFEITAEGDLRLEGDLPNEPTTRGTSYKLTGAIVLIGLAAAGLFTYRLTRPNFAPAVLGSPAPPPAADNSIAVLPFQNLSDEKQNAYFADGMQDEVLMNLAKLADLRVISRTSAAHYRSNIARNMRDIARDLGVAYVVEGSLQRMDNRIRVTVQLIAAGSDTHVWAEHYDREIADLFAVQSEIAQQVASQLHARISPEEKAAIEEQPTRDLTAYGFYVRAVPLIEGAMPSNSVHNEKDLLQAVDLLNQALARDPNFVLAYCWLARAHDSFYLQEIDHSPGRLALAKSAIDSAFRLKADSAEAHLALALHLYWGYFDYEQAGAELAIARRRLPNDSRVFEITGLIERRQGRWPDALRNLQRATELDPQNLLTLLNFAGASFTARAYEQTQKALDRALVLNPSFVPVRLDGGGTLNMHWRGDIRAWHASIDKVLADDPASAEDQTMKAERFQLAWFERDFDAADRAAATLPKKNPLEDEFTRDFWVGVVAREKADLAAARAAFTAARAAQEEALRARPEEADLISRLGVIDAALGRKEEALREGRRAVELVPIARNSLDGPILLSRLAWIYAWTAEHDLAIEQLETVSKIPAGPSYGELRLSPVWDSLRGDPRFEKILTSMAPQDAPKATSAEFDKSIAVLPFQNLSDDKQNAYFADGVQDEILSDLAKIADLRVISRTSVMQYKKAGPRNLREIAEQLGIAHVLEGSVQRAGGKVRVNAQLIDARTDRHVWARTYDRDLADVFAIESELAQLIATELQARLSTGEKAAIEEKPTRNLLAYDLYVRAIPLIDRATSSESLSGEKDLLQATNLLNQAVAQDPSFVLAYCRLARAHDLFYFHFVDRTPARLSQAKAAIDAAFRVKPESADAHLALALHLYWGYYDYDHAAAELAIARRTLPNNPQVFQVAGLIERRQGRWADAVRDLKRATELDPRSFLALTNLATAYCVTRAYDETNRTLDRALLLKPNDIGLRLDRGGGLEAQWRADTRRWHATIANILADDPASAEDQAMKVERFQLALFERDLVEAGHAARALPENHPIEDELSREFWIGVVARAQGDGAAANAAFTAARAAEEETIRARPDHAIVLSNLAMIDAALGRKEEAVAEGRRAVELMPITSNAMDGPPVATNLALTYAWTGQADLAIEQLDIVAKIPCGPSYGELRLSPVWDSLRGNPRFEKVVASLAPGGTRAPISEPPALTPAK